LGDSNTEDRVTAELKKFLTISKWIINKCKPALMPARHVQKYVKNAQKTAKEIRKWNNAKVYAEPVLMPAASVQRNAKA